MAGIYDRAAMRISRLQTLADVWGKVYLFHPAIVTLDIDWNQALIAALPRVEAAEIPAELAAVLNELLLEPLDDVMTFAVADSEVTSMAGEGLAAEMLADSTGWVRVPVELGSSPTLMSDFQQACAGLGTVKRLIVDLRWNAAPTVPTSLPELFRFFARSRARSGSILRRVHHGWAEDGDSRGYHQSWEVSPGTELVPIEATGGPEHQPFPVADAGARYTIDTSTVFLVNRASCPFAGPFLNALQAQPGIAVVHEPSGPAGIPESELNRYPEGIVVQLNVERLLGHARRTGFRPDVALPAPIGSDQLAAVAQQALDVKEAGKGNIPDRGVSPFSVSLPELRFPVLPSEAGDGISREERLLGLFKIWNVVRYFYPHLEHADIDWAECLPEWIPRMEAAESSDDYLRVLRMLTAHLHDSHVGVWFEHHVPPRPLPVEFSWVEERIVVTAASGPAPMPAIGDEVVRLGGKSAPELVAWFRPLISYSTEQAFYRTMCRALSYCSWVSGDEVVELAVRRDGQDLALNVKRTVDAPGSHDPAVRPPEPYYRLLPDNLGCIVLGKVPNLVGLDRALEELAATDGLILDNRGYYRFWMTLALVARLCDRPVRSTIFEIPVRAGSDPLVYGLETRQYLVPPHPTIHYGKPVVVLIDERTGSATEDLCIYLTNAQRVTFVGSPTTGTNGNATSIALPGGAAMSFTGMRVKFGDGSRFQNLGIIPDVPVAPTIAGIRAGQDEVLEKGIEILNRRLRVGS